MTTLREAAQQALDALTAHADLHGTMFLKMDAISALRAALAEQCKCGVRAAAECHGEWEPGCDLGANEEHAVVHEQDEPVAWINAARDVLTSHPESWGRECEEWTPLYTHPAPQRGPLTGAQIGAVAADIWGSVLIAPQSHQAFARAIEKAHGIGEQDDQSV